MQDIINAPKGRVEMFRISEGGIWTSLFKTTNTLLYDWGFIAAKAIGHGDRSYRVNMMYMEFENVVAPGDAVAVPTFTRDEGLSYYNALSGTQDFLRVPISGLPDITIDSGYEAYFTAGVTGNLLRFIAHTEGIASVLGNATYGVANNSKIFGAALVAAPVEADRTKDVVFSRTYYPAVNQVLAQASTNLGLFWDIPFTT